MTKFPKKQGSNRLILTVLGVLVYLSTPLFLSAETITTNSLIVNGDFETGNSTGWTTSGDVAVINDCCGSDIGESNYDLEFGNYGEIQQDFNLTSDTITQQMLDNGIELKSRILVQNGEGGTGGWCGSCGDADSFTVRLQIKDSEQNVLATSTQTRTDVTNITGEIFEDTLIYGSTNANIGNIFISGDDASSGYLGAGNVDEVSVTMTYDNTVISLAQAEELKNITEEILTIEPEIEEVFIEEVFIEELPTIEEVYIEEETITLAEENFIEETFVLTETPVEEIVEVIEEPMIEEQVEIVQELEEEIVDTETTEEINAEESCAGCEVEETSTVAQSPNETKVSITVDDIRSKVAEKIKSVDGQMKATQIIIAKVMQNNNNMLDSYANINADIFIQPNIVDRDLIGYDERVYVSNVIIKDRIYEDREWISR